MARITIYKNSVLATVCSMFGYGIAVSGVLVTITEDVIGGIVMIVCGFALSFLASSISESKKFSEWKKQIKKGGYTSVIQNSIQGAMQVYNTYPCKKALEYIRTLNPQAAELIDQELLAKKNQQIK